MSTSQAPNDCLFCKIVSGEVPGDVVRRTGTTLAFRDVAPQAPVHVLVVPLEHYENAAEVVDRAPQVAVDLLDTAAAVARDEGIEEGYRLVFNTGERGGQAVFHTHLHVLGGRQMGWPPG